MAFKMNSETIKRNADGAEAKKRESCRGVDELALVVQHRRRGLGICFAALGLAFLFGVQPGTRAFGRYRPGCRLAVIAVL